jgi:hypothetical protein
MILATHGIIGSSIVQFAFDADYQAVLDYATTQGYTLPSAGQQTLQNQLVLDLKAGGVWSKLDTFAVFATDGNIDFALIDWIRLTQYTAVNSPTFTTNVGFQGNGTSSYVDTNFNPSTSGVNYTLNDASRYFFPHAFGASSGVMDGSSQNINVIFRQSSTQNKINSTTNLATAFDYTGVIEAKSIHRTSSIDISLGRGTVLTSRTAISTSFQTVSQWLLRNASSSYSSHTVSAYAMGASLVAENTDFVNAYNTYKSSL